MIPCGKFIGTKKFVLLVHNAGSGLHGTLQESFAGIVKAEAARLLLLVHDEFLQKLLHGTLGNICADIVGLVGFGEGIPVFVANAVDELAAARRNLFVQVTLELFLIRGKNARLLCAQDGSYGQGYSLGAGPTPR